MCIAHSRYTLITPRDNFGDSKCASNVWVCARNLMMLPFIWNHFHSTFSQCYCYFVLYRKELGLFLILQEKWKHYLRSCAPAASDFDAKVTTQTCKMMIFAVRTSITYLLSLPLCVHSAVVWLVFTAVRFAAFHDVLAFAVRAGIRLDTSPGFGAHMWRLKKSLEIQGLSEIYLCQGFYS